MASSLLTADRSMPNILSHPTQITLSPRCKSRFYQRRKDHVQKNNVLPLDSRKNHLICLRPEHADALTAFGIAHRQYIDDCDALQKLIHAHCRMAHIQSSKFQRLVKWILETCTMHVVRFGRDHAASLVVRQLSSIFPVREIPPQVYEDKDAPDGFRGEDS
jgi:hypothetical protein